MRNLHLTFDLCSASQKLSEDFAKFVAFSEYMEFKERLNFSVYRQSVQNVLAFSEYMTFDMVKIKFTY